MAELFSKTLTSNNLGDKITEEVLINVGILMILFIIPILILTRMLILLRLTNGLNLIMEMCENKSKSCIWKTHKIF